MVKRHFEQPGQGAFEARVVRVSAARIAAATCPAARITAAISGDRAVSEPACPRLASKGPRRETRCQCLLVCPVTVPSEIAHAAGRWRARVERAKVGHLQRGATLQTGGELGAQASQPPRDHLLTHVGTLRNVTDNAIVYTTLIT